MAARLDEFAKSVLHCSKTHCPFHQTRPGAYPKFSYGNLQAEVMAVFQNPGQPTNQERLRTIETVALREMREWANSGVSNWLTRNFGDTSILEYGSRLFLDSYYMTQAYRCPDPLDTDSKKKRADAMRNCSNYLKQEISLVKPKVILCFGGQALRSVEDILSSRHTTEGIKKLFLRKKVFEWCGIRVFPLVHPKGYWKNPRIKEGKYLDTLRWYIDQIENV